MYIDVNTIPIPKTMGERIKALREERKMTQKELATMLGTQREILSEWEANKAGRQISSERIQKLADYFDVSCDYIIRGIKPEHSTVYHDLGTENHPIEVLKLSAETLRNVTVDPKDIMHSHNVPVAKALPTKDDLNRARNTIDFVNVFLKEPIPKEGQRAIDIIMDYLNIDLLDYCLDDKEKPNISFEEFVALKLLRAQRALERLKENIKS